MCKAFSIIARCAAVALLLSALVSCGWNHDDPDDYPVIPPPGGGFGYTSASLTGSYMATTFATFQDPTNYRSSLDAYAFGGTGYATYSLKAADRLMGVVLDGSNATYSVLMDGTFTLTPTGYPSLSGALASTPLGAYAEAGVMSRLGAIGSQASSVLLKTGSSMHSDTSVVGAYGFASIRDYSAESGPRVAVGSAVADGAGGISISGTATTYGGSVVPMTDNMTYHVISDGTMTATTSADLTVFGGALSDSEYIAALSATVDKSKQEAIYMVKSPALPMSNANLSGTYFMSSSYRGFYSGWGAALRRFSFNGAGVVSVVSIASDFVYGPAQTQTATGTYSMNADGTFALSFGGRTYECAISADGSAFVAGHVADTLYIEAGLAVKQ